MQKDFETVKYYRSCNYYSSYAKIHIKNGQLVQITQFQISLWKQTVLNNKLYCYKTLRFELCYVANLKMRLFSLEDLINIVHR
jgi:hypothetical protein